MENEINKEELTRSLFKLIEDRGNGAIPLYLTIRGSHAYGTSLPTSDIDFAGVMIQKMDDILGMSYKEQINDDTNDTVIYEVKRFLELVASNNPNILELLNTPEDCILYKHPVFDLILEHADSFLTKQCKYSFGGYARQQITKAKGQDKKQNWEKDKVERKQPIDFCYLIQEKGHGSVPLSNWLNESGFLQEYCGLANVPNARDTYAIYYDLRGHTSKSQSIFKGIIGENSNELRLSSIPKDTVSNMIHFIGHISYNKDGYTSHCKDYNSYQTWLENRNEARWVDVKGHGQKIDGKNMMHCVRLIEMAKEIAEGKGVNVKRPNADFLIDIRKGKLNLETLIEKTFEDMDTIDRMFNESDLPNKVDMGMIEQLLIEVRNRIYF
jgi:hypothetical protein